MRWLLLLCACSADHVDDAALPYQYFVVTRASGDLQRGFGVAQLGIVDGKLRTRSGRVVAFDDVEEARPLPALGSDRFAVAWAAERAGVWEKPDDSRPPLYSREALQRVTLEDRSAPRGWRAVHDGYMRESELRAPTVAARPRDVAPGERWIDVDTQAQTLTVYDGDRPRFVTLVSTGTLHTRFATPRGTFRINYKVPSATMDNLDEAGELHYSFEEVPWVQYFHKEVALHGTYWHQRLGHAVSHGCVNLAPADAKKVYALTRASTPAYGGTIVRVR
jgi:hypothetical protein